MERLVQLDDRPLFQLRGIGILPCTCSVYHNHLRPGKKEMVQSILKTRWKDRLTHPHFDEIYNAISKTNLRLIKHVEGSPRTYSLQVDRQVD